MKLSKWLKVTLVIVALFLTVSVAAVIYLLSVPRDHGGIDRIVLTRIQTIRSALSLYHDDNKNFPDKLDALVPKYLTNVPTLESMYSSLPLSAGICKKEQNDFSANYKRISNERYQLTFCLEAERAGLLGGIRTATESGIK